MARAAVVTGGSRGIGLALAETLASEGYRLTLTARRADGLEEAAQRLRDGGAVVTTLAANIADEDAPGRIIGHHREAYGRLDVLINSAGIGIGAPATEHKTKNIDLQFAINLRAIVLMYREAAGLLCSAGQEHRSALVVNLASWAGKAGQPWLSVYGATKAAVISYSEAMDRELADAGVKSVALCPGFVDTDMAEYMKESLGADNLIQTADLQRALTFLLGLSPACRVGEIVFRQPGDSASDA